MSSTQIPSRHPPARGAVSSVAPNQTLYLSGLPDKLQKDDLRRCLYCLCSTHGPVLDIVALKTAKMRGQAHVTFKDIQCASSAMRALNGFEFFGKPMKIQYAKSKSDTIAKLDGTFKIPTFAQPEEAVATSNDQPTDLQRAVFGAPPAAGKAAAAEPAASKDKSEEPKGVKRGREEEDEEDSDDSAMEMEESDDE
ncbi:RNA-binding domain-containing protein [Venturia nashicola]|uniref:RNA-binding domain-containing protein n=1 Tax=Venturia nashicola TaxID=86259 RepID=A0A4Z1PGV2_9PEZI|nr:RNA-binding domain-containing protein [Venturia nashicola]TLD39594.1 RNA-binding domain-containing protein [Venturia nashicola]